MPSPEVNQCSHCSSLSVFPPCGLDSEGEGKGLQEEEPLLLDQGQQAGARATLRLTGLAWLRL